jgi:hypothetical protein
MLNEDNIESSGNQTGAMVIALKQALRDPGVIGVLADAITQQLKAEVIELKKQIIQRDLRIQRLEESLDEMEQYQRRNNIRISGIPEEAGEDTDKLVVKLAETLGCSVTEADIDRSHRVGSRDLGSGVGPRPLLVKFVSYKSKRSLITSRKELKSKRGNLIYPALKWNSGQGKIFINDDLTTARARLAKEARDRKKRGDLQDTWVRDGVVFVKKGDSIIRVITMRQLAALF